MPSALGRRSSAGQKVTRAPTSLLLAIDTAGVRLAARNPGRRVRRDRTQGGRPDDKPFWRTGIGSTTTLAPPVWCLSRARHVDEKATPEPRKAATDREKGEWADVGGPPARPVLCSRPQPRHSTRSQSRYRILTTGSEIRPRSHAGARRERATCVAFFRAARSRSRPKPPAGTSSMAPSSGRSLRCRPPNRTIARRRSRTQKLRPASWQERPRLSREPDT